MKRKGKWKRELIELWSWPSIHNPLPRRQSEAKTKRAANNNSFNSHSTSLSSAGNNKLFSPAWRGEWAGWAAQWNESNEWSERNLLRKWSSCGNGMEPQQLMKSIELLLSFLFFRNNEEWIVVGYGLRPSAAKKFHSIQFFQIEFHFILLAHSALSLKKRRALRQRKRIVDCIN